MSPIEWQDMTATFAVAEDWDTLELVCESAEAIDYVVVPVDGDDFFVFPVAEGNELVDEHLGASLQEFLPGFGPKAMVFSQTAQGVEAAERTMRRQGAPFGVVMNEGLVVGVIADQARGRWRDQDLAIAEPGEGAEPAGDGDVFLQAIVEELCPDGSEVTRIDAFARGGRHRLGVSLATAATEWGVLADKPVPLDFSVPHELTVSFLADWLPTAPPQPLATEPEMVESPAATIEFTLPVDLDQVEIVVVIHELIGGERKLIQTAVVIGEAVPRGRVGDGLKFIVEPGPSRPAAVQPADVSLILGDGTLAAFARNPAVEVEVSSTAAFRADLGRTVLALWDDLEGAQEEPDPAPALLRLVARGRQMRDLLEQGLATDDATWSNIMEGSGTVQLLSRGLDVDLPIEFVYVGPRPDVDDPRLCSGHAVALEEAKCQSCPDRSNEICPFDFWGLRRRIERHVVSRPQASSANNALRTGSSVDLLPAKLGPALFGASQLLQEPGRQMVRDALERCGAPVDSAVPDWTAWAAAIADDQPRLLVLLAHSQTAERALEIEGQSRELAWIEDDYVDSTGQEPGPVVMLTGCETAQPEFGFLSAVSTFLKGGAAVVVGTLALIAEDASAKATAAILRAVREVVDSDLELERRSMGEVMRRVRCRLLAAGDLTGFNLIAYGDADWRFEMGSAQ